MEKRVITTDMTEEDIRIEGNLRPQYLEDYIGQEKAKQNLKIYIEAAKQRKDSLIMYFSTALRDWGKLRWRGSLLMRWVSI